jgi:hypothetical protein
MILQNPELLPPSASDCTARRRLTKSKEKETIIINRSGRSTYPEEKSVQTSGATPVVASASSSMIGAGIHAAATSGPGAAQGDTGLVQTGTTMAPYDVDTLFRSAQPVSNSSLPDGRAEATRILVKGLSAGDVPAADRSYLANLVAARTGMSQDDAQKRVDEVIARVKEADVKMRQAADAARKVAAAVSLVTALAMLIGAFIACAAAALGGHERNQHP